MKIGTSDRHLTYCSNIHPGERWSEVFANLNHYLPALKAKLSPNASFGVGLRLADEASQSLTGHTLTEFHSWLQSENLYVFTLNGFPYGNFHHQRVKDQVYAPDWTTTERLDYTLRLIDILAKLLPHGMDGGISTLPLSYKPWFTPTTQAAVFETSALHLAQVTARMAQLKQETGAILHLDLEPEPDGLIENSAEVINFFQTWLLPIGQQYLQTQLGLSSDAAEAHLLEHIRICYDTCHFAVEYEEPEQVFRQFQSAGIQVGKIQISAAIQVKLPNKESDRHSIYQRLMPFAESTYLHQVIERFADGTLRRHRDLTDALPIFTTTNAAEWRTHFHVPIFIQDYQTLQSTQLDIIKTLNALSIIPNCRHLEIETYTWDVLPIDMKIDVLSSIEREYQWVLNVIQPSPKPLSTPIP